MADTSVAACPVCDTRGRAVARVTLQSLLADGAKARLDDAGDLRFCRTTGCEVVYYGNGQRFTSRDLRVPVFQKSTDPARPVCYCFEHRVADIEEEIARTGSSTVPDQIADKCRRGLDRCESKNPQGTCCLGNVRQVVKAAMPDGHAGEPLRPRNVGLWSAGGAVVAAAFASACCWLPLLLVAAGASAAGVGGFFEAYRPYLLGVTALLLGAGFYVVYVRKPACAPGDACEAPNPKLVRLNKGTLWVATAFVVAFAAFPSYVGALLGGSGGAAPAATAHLETRAYVIDGMTCEGCVAGVERALGRVEGVARTEVSYADKTARVYVSPDAQVSDADVLEAISALGYRAARQQEHADP